MGEEEYGQKVGNVTQQTLEKEVRTASLLYKRGLGTPVEESSCPNALVSKTSKCLSDERGNLI